MTIQTDLQSAVAKTTAAADKLHQVVHGDAASTVETESGPVKTVAKTIADNEAAIAASRAELDQKAADAAGSAAGAAASAAVAVAAASSGMFSAVQDKNAAYAAIEADAGDLFRITTAAGPVTITLPLISALAAGVSDGFKVAVVKWSADVNAVTVAAAGTDTINGAASIALGGQYQVIAFIADAETGQWLAADISFSDAMSGGNNLAELTDLPTARANLGLGAAAVEGIAAGGAGGLLRADGDGSQLVNLPSGGKLIAVHRTTHNTDTALATCVSGGTQVGADLGVGSPPKVNVPTAGILRLTCNQADLSRISGTYVASMALGLKVGATAYFAQMGVTPNRVHNPRTGASTGANGGVSKIRHSYEFYYEHPMVMEIDIQSSGMPTGSQTVQVLVGDEAYEPYNDPGQIDGATTTAVFTLEVIDGS